VQKLHGSCGYAHLIEVAHDAAHVTDYEMQNVHMVQSISLKFIIPAIPVRSVAIGPVQKITATLFVTFVRT